MSTMHGTTILAVLRDDAVAVAGDGQVTQGEIVVKHTARKIQRLYNNSVLVGFAGSAADGMTLLDRLSLQLEQSGGQLRKAAVALARDWRTDKFLRRLEAQVVAATREEVLVISGDGDVVQPDRNFVAIGSGGPYAMAAAQALMDHTAMDARSIARASLEIAASICIYTNTHLVVETLPE
jgi:ATP-dependent HslUV protease subunit HslV